MDLATTLALILLIGAAILAVVSALAYLLYRHSLPQPPRRPGPAPAPSLDVPAPAPPASPSPQRPPAATDGAPTDLGRLSFLEYDGETFVPVSPASFPPAGEPAHDTPAPVHRANGFAWR